MLFKELRKVLTSVNYFTIRIDIRDYDTMETIKENIYFMNEIPSTYDNLKVLIIIPSDLYKNNLYQYFVTVYK